MHTLPAPPFKGMGKLIHIAAWAILFGLPFFFTGRESQTVTVLSYIRSIIVPLSFMLVFYANYSVLIDHFLFAKRPWKYFLYNVVLIAFAMGAVHLIFELLPHPKMCIRDRDLEICKKRGLKLSLLYTVIEQLKLNGTLPKQYRAHKLSGNYANYWECHIKGDWLLIWEQNDDELILILTSTGTHSDLF